MPCSYRSLDKTSVPYGDTWVVFYTHECECEGPDDHEAVKFNKGDCPCEHYEEQPTRYDTELNEEE